MTLHQQELTLTLARHRAFWERDHVDEPLVAELPDKVWRDKPYPVCQWEIRNGSGVHAAGGF